MGRQKDTRGSSSTKKPVVNNHFSISDHGPYGLEMPPLLRLIDSGVMMMLSK